MKWWYRNDLCIMYGVDIPNIYAFVTVLIFQLLVHSVDIRILVHKFWCRHSDLLCINCSVDIVITSRQWMGSSAHNFVFLDINVTIAMFWKFRLLIWIVSFLQNVCNHCRPFSLIMIYYLSTAYKNMWKCIGKIWKFKVRNRITIQRKRKP